jgi:hypothetical protein
MVLATPRCAGAWQAAQPAPGRAAAFPCKCCAWSNCALKLRKPGNFLSGGFDELRPSFVWQIVHIGFSEEGLMAAVNCVR